MSDLRCPHCGGGEFIEGPRDAATVRCAKCDANVSRMLAEFAAFAKDLVQHGTLHDCGEWPTADGMCALCGRPVNLH